MTHIHFQAPLKTKQITHTKLSPREKECVIWLAKGLRTKQIAEKLGLKVVTTHLYIQNARRKTQAKTREQLVAKAIMSQDINL